jgi:hypothetical protein
MKYVLRKEEVYTGFWWGNTSEREHLDDLGVDARIMLRWIFRKWDGGVDWIDLAQNRDKWRVFGSAVMNPRFHKIRGIS